VVKKSVLRLDNFSTFYPPSNQIDKRFQAMKPYYFCVLVLVCACRSLAFRSVTPFPKIASADLLRRSFHEFRGVSRATGLWSSVVSDVATSAMTASTAEASIATKRGDDQGQYELSPQQSVYVVLTSIFVTCLIIADVIGVKLFELPLPFEILGHKTVEHTCGMLTFPVTFLLGDVINEYYGPKAAKKTVYIGLAMSILVFIVMNVAQAMPYLDKPFNVTKESFDMIFGNAKLMYVASICAYYVGSLSDIALFGIIKKATGGKYLWLRAAGSTVISQVLDSFVVSYLAFSLGKELQGVPGASLPEVFNIAATGYGLKFFLSACMIPFLYVIKGVLTEQMGLVPIPASPVTGSEEESI